VAIVNVLQLEGRRRQASRSGVFWPIL